MQPIKIYINAEVDISPVWTNSNIIDMHLSATYRNPIDNRVIIYRTRRIVKIPSPKVLSLTN
jgi:hypothetical protein